MVFSLFLLVLAGCRHGNRCETVERELYRKEREAEDLRGELHKYESFNHALQRQLHEMHQVPACPAPGCSAKPPCGDCLGAGVKEIVLGRLTGGYDDDRCYGDEALQVIVEPRDCDGSSIKAPGALRITAMQITPQGIKIPLSCWELSPEDLRRTWKSGLLSTGYSVIVPWKNPPTTEKLRIVAQFALPDGRAFEADKDVTIRLQCDSRPQTVPPPPGEVIPELAPVPKTCDGPELTHAAKKPKVIAESKTPGPRQRPLHETVHILRPVPQQ